LARALSDRFSRTFFGALVLPLVVMIGTAIVYAQFDPFNQPIRGDRANWEYMAQVITRGGVPYRDAVNIKTPLSAYIGAGAILLMRPFGVRDIYAVRLTYLALAVLCVGFVYLVALEYFKSRRIAILAATIMAGVNFFATTNSAGIQPKTPVVLFALISLWAAKRDLPFLAGVSGMLCALAWQPGLMFAGVAGLVMSRYLTSWRDLRAIKVIGGAAIPLAVMLLYFWQAGALRDFYLWTFDFNLHVYGPREARPLSHFLVYLRRMVAFRSEELYCVLAAIGALYWTWHEAKGIRLGGLAYLRQSAPGHALLLAGLAYFGFCLINVQGTGDFLPFLPFIAIFAAFAIVTALDTTIETFSALKSSRHWRVVGHAGFAVIVAVVTGFSVADAFTYKKKTAPLKEQEAEVAQIVSHLNPGDTIYVHGPTEVLVLSGLTNASKYFLIDRGKDDYMSRFEPGGFDGWLTRLKSERPKVVMLTRLRKEAHQRKAFNEWVRGDYEEHKLKRFTYYLRRD
jgi:hypothetical protein